ncbi:hypothetical protein T265_15035, partial [Opisthorchis viverrini]
MEFDSICCVYCLHDLSGAYVECTDCSGVILCLEVSCPCFCSGAEAGSHKKTHGYRFKSASKNASVSIFGGWAANEEQQLLEALEHYGVGNWYVYYSPSSSLSSSLFREDVSLKVETRSPLECMEHYGAYYLDTMLGSNTLCQSAPTPRVTDHTADSSQSTPTMQASPAVYMEVEDQQLLGYMPARGDFERDYDNDAESILCRLHPSFSYDDLEDALKVAQVGIYMQRLRERQRRKEIAREHGLIAPILAFILNKRLKKRIPWKKRAASAHGPGSRRRGRPPSPRRHLQLGKCTSQKTTPIKRTSFDSSSLLLEPQSSSPPPGSWLAAPYVLKASGATRGTPLVASGLATNTLPSRLATTQSLRPNAVRPGSFLPLRENSYFPENHTVFSLNEKLKPFLRYFTGPQGKHFMDNLYREELLKFEIKYLMDCHAKGKVKLNISGSIIRCQVVHGPSLDRFYTAQGRVKTALRGKWPSGMWSTCPNQLNPWSMNNSPITGKFLLPKAIWCTSESLIRCFCCIRPMRRRHPCSNTDIFRVSSARKAVRIDVMLAPLVSEFGKSCSSLPDSRSKLISSQSAGTYITAHVSKSIYHVEWLVCKHEQQFAGLNGMPDRRAS